jgi:hypothetical protein
LMHLGYSTVRKSLSLIVIEDSFHRISLADRSAWRPSSPTDELGLLANAVVVGIST